MITTKQIILLIFRRDFADIFSVKICYVELQWGVRMFGLFSLILSIEMPTSETNRH